MKVKPPPLIPPRTTRRGRQVRVGAGQLNRGAADGAEDLFEEGDFAAPRWRPAGVIVNHATIGETVGAHGGDFVAIIKRDGNNGAFHGAGQIEGSLLLNRGDVIPGLLVKGAGLRWVAHPRQHGFLGVHTILERRFLAFVCEEAATVDRAGACPQDGDATKEGNSNQVSSAHRVHPISANAKGDACIVLSLPITRNWQQIKAKMPKN